MAMSLSIGGVRTLSCHRTNCFLSMSPTFTCRLRSKKSRQHRKRTQPRKISQKRQTLNLNRSSLGDTKKLPQNGDSFSGPSVDSVTDGSEKSANSTSSFATPKLLDDINLDKVKDEEDIEKQGENDNAERLLGIQLEDLINMIKDAEKNILLLNEARVRALEELNQVVMEKEDLQGQVDILKMHLAEKDARLLMADQEKAKYNILREEAEGLERITNADLDAIVGHGESTSSNVASFSVVATDKRNLEEENKILKEEIQHLNDKIVDMNKKTELIKKLQNEKSLLEENMNQLESRIAVSEGNVNELAQLKAKYQCLQSDAKRLKEELAAAGKSQDGIHEIVTANKSLQEKVASLERDLSQAEATENELARVKAECQSLQNKVKHLQEKLKSATSKTGMEHFLVQNQSLQEKVERLERDLIQAEADKDLLEQMKKENLILRQQVRVLEQRLLESDKEIRMQLQRYQQEVQAFQRSLEEMSKHDEPVQDMPWEFWSNLLLSLDGWMLEKKMISNDAKLLREMAWSRDARIRDAYVQNQNKDESELIVSLLRLIKSATRPGLHVVHIAAEVAPVAKVGGLADVVTGLGKALQRRGHLLEVIIPKYDCMDYSRIGKLKVLDTQIDSYFDGQFFKNKVWLGTVEGLPVYFIEPYHPARFFWRGQFYGEGDDFRRFTYFCRAALEFLLQSGKKPDIIHCHDWQTAIVAPLYWEIYAPQGLNSARISFTCHNFEYQGTEFAGALASCGLDVQHLKRPDRMQDDSGHDRINAVKGGIVFSNIVTTVSPTYAEEVRSSEGGRGLHSTLANHARKFHGILNGIDTEAWDPSTDHFLDFQYSAEDLSGKTENKRALQKYLGLAIQSSAAPLVGCITRLVPQKGIHLIRHAIYRTLECGGQFVLLGSSPVRHIQHEFEGIANQFSGHPSIRLVLKYDEALSHYIYAGSDIFIVPSIFEPCGLTQMIAMRYGSIPIARKTGGLNDSVFDVDDETIPTKMRNGFTFSMSDEQALNYALDRAISYFKQNPSWWSELVKRAMKIDFSWDASATQYEELYEKAVAKARSYQAPSSSTKR